MKIKLVNSEDGKEINAPKKLKLKKTDAMHIDESVEALTLELFKTIEEAQNKVPEDTTPINIVGEEKKEEVTVGPIVTEQPAVTEHKYSFEMEQPTEIPKWREAKQTTTVQMPETSHIKKEESADFNLELACKNTDEKSMEHQIYSIGLSIINSLKQEKEILVTELDFGKKSYSEQIDSYDAEMKRLQEEYEAKLRSLEDKKEEAKVGQENYIASMNDKINNKEKEINTKRNEIKLTGQEAKKADNLAKEQEQLAKKQLEIITGMNNFSPELTKRLKPSKIVNLNGETPEQENIFTKIRENEEPSARTM